MDLNSDDVVDGPEVTEADESNPQPTSYLDTQPARAVRPSRLPYPLFVGLCLSLGVVVFVALHEPGSAFQMDRNTRSTDSPASILPTGQVTAPRRASEPEPAGGVGERLRDGSVEFVVTAMDCSQTKLGQDAKVTARGQFCVLNVQATNGGTERVSLPTQQSALESDGNWVAADYVAQTYLAGPSLYSTQLEPSATASGPLVFDVHYGTRLKSVRLNGQSGSNGVVVKLS